MGFACPVCASLDTDEVIQRHSVEAAAEHFVPEKRFAERNAELRRVIRRLWGGRAEVEIHRCDACGFAFPIPYVAGDVAFYNLAFGSGGYPRDRWEFDQTLDALTPIALARSQPLKLLEAGAGVGWFLEAIRRRPALHHRVAAEAIEYDDVALRTLTERGFAARAGSITDLVGDPEQKGRFDVICMFQTLEHMAGVTEVFQAFRSLLRPDGHVFLSVPNGPSVEHQEKMVELWDMPPNHVGRWSLRCFDIAAKRNGIEVVASAVEPQWARHRDAWHYATYRLASRAYVAGTWEHRINAVRRRPVRQALKGLTSLAWMPRFWFTPRGAGHNLWVNLQRVEAE